MSEPLELKEVTRHFQISGRFQEAAPQGRGHINDTYQVRMEAGGTVRRYILQRINSRVFPDIPRLMENIARVTGHLRMRLAGEPGGDPDREALTPIPARDGRSFWQDGTGGFWRVYLFIEGIRVVETAAAPGQAFEASRAFGRFLRLLRDLPPPALHETIPGFHHTPRRFAALADALRRDSLGRAAEARREIDFALDRAPLAGVLVAQQAAGRLPVRATHNDTKINNVLLDDASGRGLAVIDLDTVMPGLVAYDFGDMVRTFTCTGQEDEPDPDRIVFRPEYYEALARGFASEAGPFLTPAEWAALETGGRLITLEIGIRFLTDYLEGDVYFKTRRPAHNLDRTRVQFQRLRLLEGAGPAMADVIDRCRWATAGGALP
jgi:Ser/Thr protein kinase RdoA (MazF antagonist)